LAEFVWDLSDGSCSLEGLAQAASKAFDRVVHKEEVFSALDFLADAGLLEQRIAPPVAEGKVSRRSLLVQIAPVVGVGMILGASARAGGLFQDHGETKGTWKHVTPYSTMLWTFSYTSTGPRTGVLETFLGEPDGRADLRWISPSEFEYTPTRPGSRPGFDVIRFVRDY
jgi:hypothetical protein